MGWADREMAERSAPKPDALTYVIGDVHGCIDPLSELLRKIDDDTKTTEPQATSLVFVGDYIDRGPDSAAVLRFLHEMCKANRTDVICLLGNHEAMLLDFLADPLGGTENWLRYGGHETMASFGIDAPEDPSDANRRELLDLAGALRTAMGGLLLSWLKGLPLSWRSGNMWAVHAGADPFVPMEEQDPSTLLWGHQDFRKVDRSDKTWIVVGHTAVDYPRARRGKIHIDTGAVYGGPLTALRADPNDDDVRFIQAFPAPQ